MTQLDEPNVSFALAPSYNPRGMLGFTNTVTNAIDQRRINCFYEINQNSASGKTTLYLTKRPGVSDSGVTFGTTGQVAYLITLGAGLFTNTVGDSWVLSVNGSDVRASDSVSTNVIVTAASYFPKYVDKALVNGSDTVVAQLFNATTSDMRTFYSTAIATWTEITDSVFAALTHIGKMEFMDGWAFVCDKATQRIYNSSLNTLATWPATNYITKQIKQDELRGLARLGKKIVAFATETSEVFVNAGTESGSPLITVPDLAFHVGTGGTFGADTTHNYAVVGEKMYFIGRTELAGVGLYAFDGVKCLKVSRGAIDKILHEQWHASAVAIYSVSSFAYAGKEGVALQLTATSAATQRWLIYFPEWNDWFEWVSTVFTPVNQGRWYLGVGANQHKLYNFSDTSANWQDAGTNYQWLTQFQVPKNGSARKFMRMCGLVGDTARSALNIAVEFSDDDYQTFSTARNIDMTAQKKNLYRCGSYQDGRVTRLSYTGSLEVRLEKFMARIE